MHELSRFHWRLYVLLGVLVAALAGLSWRLIDLNILSRAFLLQQSKARILRTVSTPAYRGIITDRFNAPLAISTPVSSVWVNPKIFHPSTQELAALSTALEVPISYLQKKSQEGKDREFIYLRRRVSPTLGAAVSALDLKGVYLQREYKRFYPEADISAHVIGMTDVDDRGQEGVELAYNKWLSGVPGRKEVLKDRLGQVIANVALLKQPQQGQKLELSIDHRIQYLAYRVLKATTQQFNATAGSVVVLDIKTGEVLAMVNQPSYNPNDRPADYLTRYRNRAATDVFEPGSTMKPFAIAFALSTKRYKPTTVIDTNPGWMMVGGYKISDDDLNGRIDLKQIVQKSSNVGAAKILLSLEPQPFWKMLHELGFGERTTSGFPGEAPGRLIPRLTWQPSVVATLAYGYGIAVTTLQLAHAYSILANDGVSVPVEFLKTSTTPVGTRVISSRVAHQIMDILESVVQPENAEVHATGTRAAVPGYRVAGKTGTAYIANSGGYDRHRYMSSFVGMAPASNPRIVVAVVINNPKGQHMGALVAAPAFSKIMGGTLRLLDIAPDAAS